MPEPIIKVENLSKSFVITHEQRERYVSLRDVIATRAKRMFSGDFAKKDSSFVSKEEFWAIKDVSFEIQPGDRLGIIGRNGAGKSTLLKMLSRITEPTAGRIEINGRIASLLEVGTGFHPELTGRENIYLNGAILGMSRAEIRRKFDEIVAFAEVEKFLDTPVKRYSSGMYVRLAFAVAAHLEPEILIVDEVLAVGDAQFQKKCLGKMEEVSKNEGRTVLFVSHNMNVIKSLCTKGLLLSNGKLIETGSASELVNKYLEASADLKTTKYSHKLGGSVLSIFDLTINNSKDTVVKLLTDLHFQIKFTAADFRAECEFFLLIYNNEGVCVQGVFQSDNQQYTNVISNEGVIQLTLTNTLIPGRYFISVGAFDRYRNFLDWVEYCETLEVEPVYQDGRIFQNRLGSTIGNKAVWTQ
jgi:lipopolysaccharide transport system ATP-binding protein